MGNEAGVEQREILVTLPWDVHLRDGEFTLLLFPPLPLLVQPLRVGQIYYRLPYTLILGQQFIS